MYHDLIISGFGGQGIMVIGHLLAHAAMKEDRYVTFFPSYGPIMRGGTANCTVIISSKPIGSPIIRNPLSAILMNIPSVTKYEKSIKSGGLAIFNSDLIDKGLSKREDVERIFIPAVTIAEEIGSDRVANMVLAGAFIERTGVVYLESAIACLSKVISQRHLDLIHLDEEAVRRGAAYMKGVTVVNNPGE